jgi:hypothetical protein
MNLLSRSMEPNWLILTVKVTLAEDLFVGCDVSVPVWRRGYLSDSGLSHHLFDILLPV